MPNGTYGGVRGRKTKVGRKLLRFPPTRSEGRVWQGNRLCGSALYTDDRPQDVRGQVGRKAFP